MHTTYIRHDLYSCINARACMISCMHDFVCESVHVTCRTIRTYIHIPTRAHTHTHKQNKKHTHISGEELEGIWHVVSTCDEATVLPGLPSQNLCLYLAVFSWSTVCISLWFVAMLRPCFRAMHVCAFARVSIHANVCVRVCARERARVCACVCAVCAHFRFRDIDEQLREHFGNGCILLFSCARRRN
jgi:hypothetical protein